MTLSQFTNVVSSLAPSLHLHPSYVRSAHNSTLLHLFSVRENYVTLPPLTNTLLSLAHILLISTRLTTPLPLAPSLLISNRLPTPPPRLSPIQTTLPRKPNHTPPLPLSWIHLHHPETIWNIGSYIFFVAYFR